MTDPRAGFNGPPSPDMQAALCFASSNIAGMPLRPLALSARTAADISEDLTAQFESVLDAFESRKARLYHSGVLHKCDSSVQGRPAELEFEEVYVKLRGCILTIMHRVAPPTFVNITDGRFQVDDDYTEITINAQGVRFVLRSQDESDGLAIRRWYTALHLALFERARLQELYTAWLVNRFRTSDMFDLAPGEEKWRGTVELRIASDGLSIKEYTSCFCIVRQAVAAQAKRNLFGKKSKTEMTPAKEAQIALYHKRGDKEPFAVVYAFAAYALYPDKPEFVAKSGLVKLEGTVAIKATGTSSEGHVLMMMPKEPVERQSLGALQGAKPSHTVVKFLNSIWLCFELHGRPENLLIDVEHPESLGGVLLSLDINDTIKEGIEDLHSQRDWRRTLRERVIHKGYYSRASMTKPPVQKQSLGSQTTLVQRPATAPSASSYFARQAEAARRTSSNARAREDSTATARPEISRTVSRVSQGSAPSEAVPSCNASTAGESHGYASSLLSHARSSTTAPTEYDAQSEAGSRQNKPRKPSTSTARASAGRNLRGDEQLDRPTKADLESIDAQGEHSPYLDQTGFVQQDALALVRANDEVIEKVERRRGSDGASSGSSHKSKKSHDSKASRASRRAAAAAAAAAMEVGVPIDDHDLAVLRRGSTSSAETAFEATRDVRELARTDDDASDEDASDVASTYSNDDDDFGGRGRVSKEPTTPPTYVRVTTDTYRTYMPRKVFDSFDDAGSVRSGRTSRDGDKYEFGGVATRGAKAAAELFKGSVITTVTALGSESAFGNEPDDGLLRVDTNSTASFAPSTNPASPISAGSASATSPSATTSPRAHDLRTLGQIRAELRKTMRLAPGRSPSQLNASSSVRS